MKNPLSRSGYLYFMALLYMLRTTRKSIRFFILFLLLLAFSGSAVKPVAATGLIRDDSVVIEKRRIVLVRRGKFIRDFPERRRAVINYPFIKSGLSSAAVLRKVRSLLQFKNIFDTSLAEYRADTWLSEFDYEVNYNKNFILDITFTQSGMAAYPDTHSKHFAISLKTGEVIKARDVFKPAALRNLAELVDKKLQEEINEIRRDVAQAPDSTPEDKQAFQEQFAQLKFQVENLDEFSIGDKGITFLYDAGFPHVIQALEPVGKYFFSYAELRSFIKTEGPLGSFVR
jgi:hypothetical protein